MSLAAEMLRYTPVAVAFDSDRLSLSIEACRHRAEECERHADTHEHCRVCAESCHRCAEACRVLLAT